jgi:hypothetical protein
MFFDKIQHFINESNLVLRIEITTYQYLIVRMKNATIQYFILRTEKGASN